MTARQLKAGRALNISGSVAFDYSTDTALPYVGVGVTTTSTPPVLLSDCAYNVGLDATSQGTDFWDAANSTDTASNENGVTLSEPFTLALVKQHLPLDSNFVAGRYLWLIAFEAGSGVPASGDTIVLKSAPYHIL
jgi:hypothetical protein